MATLSPIPGIKAFAAVVLFCPACSAVALYFAGWPKASLFNVFVEIAAIILVAKVWRKL